MVSLDVVEKYSWTVFDFLFKRPRKFFSLRSNNPERYMDPIPFAVVNFLLYEAVLVATVKVLSNILDWSYVTGAKLHIPVELDLPTVIGVAGGGTLFMLGIVVAWFMLAAKLVRRKMVLKDLVISICFSMSTNVIAVAYFGLFTFFGLVLGSISPESANTVGRILYIGWLFLGLIIFGYFISSAAVSGNMRFRRMLVGVILAMCAFFFVIFILGILIGLIMAFA